MLSVLAGSGHLVYDVLCFVSLLFRLPVRPCCRAREFFYFCPNPLSVTLRFIVIKCLSDCNINLTVVDQKLQELQGIRLDHNRLPVLELIRTDEHGKLLT
jgi:hypothetical protein